jgi:membrane protein
MPWHMFPRFEMNVSWTELIKRTAQQLMAHDGQGAASQLAYYLVLAFFPALLCLVAIASFFPLQEFTPDITRLLAPFAPRELIEIIEQEMSQIANGQHGGLLAIGLFGALWSGSSALIAMIGAMNKAYEIDEGRSWWKLRLTAVLLTLALTLLTAIAFSLVILGPHMAHAVATHFGLGSAFVWSWRILQWPVAFVLLAVAIGFIYYFAPDAEQLWVWITPGSLLATLLALLGSLAFRVYAENFGDYEATYGAIGGVILLLLWFYLLGLAIVIGGEMNAVIEHASPWAKAPGEKVPPAS